jgi:hypothetical protein
MSRSSWILILGALIGAVTAPGARAHQVASSPLDGTWKWTWTRAEVVRGGGNDTSEVGTHIATFANGVATSRNLRTGRVERARFTVHGNTVDFVFGTTMRPHGVVVGTPYRLRWSIYRDRLTFATVSGRPALELLPITPWIRVG